MGASRRAEAENVNRYERRIHRLFRISVWIKGLFALTEVAGGIAAFFATHQFLLAVAARITQGELAEDPHDVIANALLQAAQRLSLGTQHFLAVYLLGHGLIKLWVIAGLLRERLWYYPVSLVVFGLFIAYQLDRYAGTHSPWLLVVTALDLVVIALTWHEYRYLKRQIPAKTG
ncbi:MAG: DUF2127 domain-containing protein [Alphaproteobacteria bacterium]|nr:DUF2127 domain-containing protein [Alphaproteobacteria bacterium]